MNGKRERCGAASPRLPKLASDRLALVAPVWLRLYCILLLLSLCVGFIRHKG